MPYRYAFYKPTKTTSIAGSIESDRRRVVLRSTTLTALASAFNADVANSTTFPTSFYGTGAAITFYTVYDGFTSIDQLLINCTYSVAKSTYSYRSVNYCQKHLFVQIDQLLINCTYSVAKSTYSYRSVNYCQKHLFVQIDQLLINYHLQLRPLNQARPSVFRAPYRYMGPAASPIQIRYRLEQGLVESDPLKWNIKSTLNMGFWLAYCSLIGIKVMYITSDV
ncbi:hypothetical protein EV127DRAFT_501774 [Xylaria flabelliformis]|nr:hypothetical protein EV127DRAFT_501774 [Xylaria flabelliformis]